MSTALVIEGSGESRTEAAARRLRGGLAERRLSARQLAMQMGVSYTWMSRRINGKISMSLDDLEMIESASGISVTFLVTGVNAENRHPDHPNGETCLLCTPRDLNPEPTVSSSAEIAEASKSSSVVRMIPRTTPVITREADAEVIALHGRRVEGVEAR